MILIWQIKLLNWADKSRLKKFIFYLCTGGESISIVLGHDGSAFAKIRDFTEEELEKWKDHYKSFSDYVILVSIV